MKTFKKILIANRGEIAVRIIRAAKTMGIQTVAIFTEADSNSLHVSMADDAVLIPGESLHETYLNQQLIIQIAQERNVEAIHPGYGFLAENAVFAEAVIQSGLIFIGPTSEQIRLMGDKNRAIDLVRKLKIPVLKSAKGNQQELISQASEIGFPLMVKAAAGGGGKGMFIVSTEDELEAALEKAARQANAYFGSGELFIEKYVKNARHIEVQLLGDKYNNLLHLFERECSIQRRFQKIIEEAPSAFVTSELREKLCSAALEIGNEIAYCGLGTVEFLVDDSGNFWFLEMNTRIQVEHPVTEIVTGFDLVEQQLLVAAGNSLEIKQSDITLKGHAIEARICSEDVERDFRPSTGTIEQCFFPEAVGLRTDSFIQDRTAISPLYDSLLAKQIASAPDREMAVKKLSESLQQTYISGVKTNIPYLFQLLADERFQNNEISISFLADFEFNESTGVIPVSAAYLFFHFFRSKEKADNIWQQLGFWRQNMSFPIWIDKNKSELSLTQLSSGIILSCNEEAVKFGNPEWNSSQLILQYGHEKEVFFIQDRITETTIYFRGKTHQVRSNLLARQLKISKKTEPISKSFQQKINSDLYGKVLSVAVQCDDIIQKNAVLLTIESMKTEFRILCPQTSIIKNVFINAGEMIKDGQLLVELGQERVSENFTLNETHNNPISKI